MTPCESRSGTRHAQKLLGRVLRTLSYVDPLPRFSLLEVISLLLEIERKTWWAWPEGRRAI